MLTRKSTLTTARENFGAGAFIMGKRGIYVWNILSLT